jgi:hypothetical protein
MRLRAPPFFLDFPPIARRARVEHFVSVMLSLAEQGNGINRIADDCVHWFAGRNSDDGSGRCLVGKIRFNRMTSNEIAQAATE